MGSLDFLGAATRSIDADILGRKDKKEKKEKKGGRLTCSSTYGPRNLLDSRSLQFFSIMCIRRMRTGLNIFSLSPYRNVGHQRMRSSAGGASTGAGGA